MRHVGTLARRELRSLFASPVAYVVLSLWSVMAGFFFLAQVVHFENEISRMQQYGAFEHLRAWNLNDHLLNPFFGSMWIVLIFAVPGICMGLLAGEKANRTEELLLTSPLSIWEIVLGKYLAAAVMVLLMTAIVGFYAALLFLYGDPEVGKTLCGLLGIFLVSLSYAAVGLFASALTRNFLVAFFIAFGLLVGLLILPFAAELGVAGQTFGSDSSLAHVLRWLSTGGHFEQISKGWVDTEDLFYFFAFPMAFLVLAKTALESVRWR